jgi:hypothetical protein
MYSRGFTNDTCLGSIHVRTSVLSYGSCLYLYILCQASDMPMLSSITEIELHVRAHGNEKGRGQYLVGYDMICRIFNMGPEWSEIHTLY